MLFRIGRATHRRPAVREARRRGTSIDGALQSVGRSGQSDVNLVELAAVEVGYHGTAVLPPIDVQFAAGDTLGIVGPNGSGKTTLVRTMLGLLPPIGGAIKFPSGKKPRCG